MAISQIIGIFECHLKIPIMKRTLLLILTALSLSLSALAQPREIKVFVGGAEFEMVRIDPGTVTLPVRTGYTVTREPHTGKVLDVSASIVLPEVIRTIQEPFYIFKYPLTQAQWQVITHSGKPNKGEKGRYPFLLAWSDERNGDNNYDSHVVPFIKKMKELSGLPFALPTLEEWLFACGPVPEDVEEYAWLDGNYKHPVGAKLPNANGLYDMLGLVGEMVEQEVFFQEGLEYRGFTHYVGGLPLVGAKKQVKKDPGYLLDLSRQAPVSSAWPPSFRLVLKGVPEDCPGFMKTQIVREGSQFGLETEFGMVLKPEYDAIKMVEVDQELSYGGFLTEKNGKWGVFNRKGEALLPMIFVDEKTATANIPFLEFVSYSYNYRQEAQRLSATKGEFEKTADFEARKADPALQKAYVESLMKDYQKDFIDTIIKDKRTGIVLLDYDADKEMYRFKVANARTLWTDYELNVPIDAAPAFKEYVKSAPQQELLQSAKWGIVDDCAQILQITFTLPDGRSFTYSNPAAGK